MVVVGFLLLSGLHNKAANSKFRNGGQYRAYMGHPGGINHRMLERNTLCGLFFSGLWTWYGFSIPVVSYGRFDLFLETHTAPRSLQWAGTLV